MVINGGVAPGWRTGEWLALGRKGRIGIGIGTGVRGWNCIIDVCMFAERQGGCINTTSRGALGAGISLPVLGRRGSICRVLFIESYMIRMGWQAKLVFCHG